VRYSPLVVCLLAACSSPASSSSDPDAAPGADGGSDSGSGADGGASHITTVFVLPFENKSSTQIYGDTTDAPYLNSLFTRGAHATMFQDELPSLPSEPHYLWMEAATNAFSDRTFTTDADASKTNSTASTDHLVNQLEAAGVPWVSYQEGITTHTCPITTNGNYVAKHDPFVFFKDVSGATPSAGTARCADHHKSYADFATDLAAGMTGYVFITANVCHEMHGGLTCPSFFDTAANIQAGDAWLGTEMPRLLAYTDSHREAIILLVWDEGDTNNLIPFLALGSHVKPGYVSNTVYTHSALVASVQDWFGVPRFAADASSVSFSDLLQ
jgi:hypothetical protein